MAAKKYKTAVVYNAALGSMAYSGFCFTVGQFVPVYFVNRDTRAMYYLVLFVILVISLMIVTLKMSYYPERKNLFSSLLISLVFGGFTFVVFGFWALCLLFCGWTEATTCYVKKGNPEVKIITRYIDNGAYGGGTEPGDFHLVVHRPFLNFLKIETPVDTLCINKQEWVRPYGF